MLSVATSAFRLNWLPRSYSWVFTSAIVSSSERPCRRRLRMVVCAMTMNSASATPPPGVCPSTMHSRPGSIKK